MDILKDAQGGSVLLEALIAILIFSMGILALVGLQAQSVTTVSEARYRTDAGLLANKMIGALWATRSVNASGVASVDNTFACNPCIAPANGAAYAAVNGNDQTKAWASSVIGSLPRPGAIVVISGGDAAVTLSWQPPQENAPHNYTVSAKIN